MRWKYLGAITAVAMVAGTSEYPDKAAAAEPLSPLCAAIARALDASAPTGGPAFIASYQDPPDGTRLPAALSGSAFAYDNALAAIALVACDETAKAQRIADAFLLALAHDRTYRDGRIRNAYAAGPVAATALKLPGWWNATERRWSEDVYQDGTDTGNVAWVSVGLLNVYAASGRAEYLAGARRLLGWIERCAANGPGPQGYAGGLSGFDGNQATLTWKSTEHNIDIAAAAFWVAAITHDGAEAAMAQKARAFVETRFIPNERHFLLGTNRDGSDTDAGKLALDVQLWPSLGVADAPAEWRQAIGFAQTHLQRDAGMTFAGLGPNAWTEGSAQAALALRAANQADTGDGLLKKAEASASPSGFLFATSRDEVPTGLTVEGSSEAFKYFHWPHLGATAWATLAAERWNPFTGKRIGS